jgi:phage-related protein
MDSELAGGPAQVSEGSPTRNGRRAKRGADWRQASESEALKGFQGSGIVEIANDYDGNTYRAVYTVRWFDVVYVLHAFQKKSKRGIETPKYEIELVRRRLKLAEEDYQHRQGTK